MNGGPERAASPGPSSDTTRPPTSRETPPTPEGVTGQSLTVEVPSATDAAGAITLPSPTPGSPPRSRWPRRRVRERAGDRAFRQLTAASSTALLLILIAIALFLLQRALPAISKDTSNFLTTTSWFPDNDPPAFGIAAITVGTLVTSALAVAMAVPVAIGIALAVTHYLPKRAAQPVAYVVDLLAAVPSVVYGLWGLFYLVPAIIPLSRWLARYFGWIPIFHSDGIFGKSIFTASIVLAIMILPIIAAITREVFAQVPSDHIEAAYALGATKWEMIRTAVLPYGRPGMISALVLGFGRAMGETIAVALVLSANYTISWHLLTPGGNTIAANIANTYGDAGTIGQGALIASGLILFAITLLVNFAGRAIINRRRDFRGAAS